jgi:hypothetical protein
MSTGALIFAHNNTGIDYTKLAVFSSARVKEFLNINCIITKNPKDAVSCRTLYETYNIGDFKKLNENNFAYQMTNINKIEKKKKNVGAFYIGLRFRTQEEKIDD